MQHQLPRETCLRDDGRKSNFFHKFLILSWLQDLERELESRVPGNQVDYSDMENITKQAKKIVSPVLLRYDNLQALDKLYEAQHNVDAIQVVMNQNIQQVMKNTQDIEVISIFYNREFTN